MIGVNDASGLMDLMNSLTALARSLANFGSEGKTLGPIVNPATETQISFGCLLSQFLICFFIVGESLALLTANPGKLRLFAFDRPDAGAVHGSIEIGLTTGVEDSGEDDDPPPELFDGGGAVSDMVNVTSFVLLKYVDVPVTAAVTTQFPTAV